jgi:hypothetical protein
MKQNQVRYESTVRPASGRSIAFFIVCAVLAFTLAAVFAHNHQGATVMSLLMGIGSMAVGLNTVAYEYPVSGATAPTASQARIHQSMSAIVTGDGSATTFVITHNWGLSAADLTNGFPWVQLEVLITAGYTAAALVTTKATNSVTFTCTGFTGAGLRVRLERPYSMLR